jgi:two-component system, OmpR family, sensor kinase
VENTAVGLTRREREFIGDTGHELRDPLTICRGYLELLGDDPEERRRTIALVLDELDRMARTVDQLQLLAEAEEPDFLQPEPIDLGPFAHELTTKASAIASRRWTVEHVADGELLADPRRMIEAVMNLAHNAVQHTDPDDTIAIGTSLSEDEARVWVRDTGTGIPVADQARIFDRFTRGGNADRRHRGGGLGLAVVRAIAEAHGGRVDLESRLGQGSSFTIVLPRHPREVPPNERPNS